MEGLFDLGISCFGHELYYKSDIEDAEYVKEAIVSCLRSLQPQPKSKGEYHERAKKVLNG